MANARGAAAAAAAMVSGASENTPDYPVLDEQLEALCRARRELPTALDRLQMVFAGGSLQQARGQDVGGGNGVLDSPIYADTADRRHRVSRISIHNKLGRG